MDRLPSNDLIGTWLDPTNLCFFPNEINKNSMLKKGSNMGDISAKAGFAW
jgi:hypothetical protein